MCTNTTWLFLTDQSHLCRQCKSEPAANRHAFAMQQTIRISCRGLQCMTKCMAKVQQRPVALFCFVSGHNLSLHLDRAFYSCNPEVHIACCHCCPIFFKPGKKLCIPKQSIFQNLAVSSKKIARRQRVQHSRISQHKTWLVKGTSKVFALCSVYASLAANRTVHLCQKRCRNLHKPHATAHDRCGEPNQISNHPAAKRHNDISPFNFLV